MASGLTPEGAEQYIEDTKGRTPTMGMFDKPQYLTGENDPYVHPGDTFWLHNARLDGTATVRGKEREQVKLLVSRERDGEQTAVFTTGAGIVPQIKRMDENDRRNLPLHVRLDQVPSREGSPTNVLTPADQAPPAQAAEEDIPF